jgi:D-glycero-alpha-D-manno-heptose 1-phosphate guanylyltransferase
MKGVKEAIILAGGLGTRLREAVPDLPKAMAMVAGRPFISYVIDYLRMQGIERFIFSLGYKSEIIEEYLSEQYPTLDYFSVVENEPLGTGGAIRLAIGKAGTGTVLVANGDTMFRINVPSLLEVHRQHEAECTLALKWMQNFNRYGVVEKDEGGKIYSFREKQFYEQGLINGGMYLVDRTKFMTRSFPPEFSFEKDYLESFCAEGKFYASVQEGYFIDIGIPEDYKRAQQDFKKPALDLSKIDSSWTLFLDRDGVINDERVGQYVLTPEEFVFSKGVLESFKLLKERFSTIIVISNQRGVGKGLMTEEMLNAIHRQMKKEVAAAGGHIDAVYYCTEKEDKCFYRKPNPGMAVKVAGDFPHVNFSKSIMVGNKPGDMRFGRAAGMFTVFVSTTNPGQPYPHLDIDLIYPDLPSFALALQS